VQFEPGLDELRAATGAAVALLDLGDETVDTLTPPLLVRELLAGGDDRAALYVRHATGLDEDGALVWSCARLDPAVRPVRPEPCPAAPQVRRPTAPPRPSSRPPEQPAPRLSSTTRTLPAAGEQSPARLAIFPARAHDPPTATLLWIRARRGPLDAAAAVRVPLPDTGTATAVLDLPLHWPADATLDALHEQIVGAVQASVESLAGAPIVVGGHSFGATLALFALARVPGLAAGIAHSGCYNRTHTPFGFHHERRRLWDVPEIYDAFSALAFADRIRRPVLIVHGLEDANPATHPDEAAQLYRAIVANAGSARLVLLPGEEHNFRYRETHARLARIHRDWLKRASDAA
jgi:dienelactone hydrolase